MKKRIKSLMGVALALVMCLTMAPTATAKADEAVALSEYTEEQLLQAILGFWTNDDSYEFTVEKEHILIERYFYGDVTTFVDVDWSYSGVVTLEERIVSYANSEYEREEIDFGVYVTFENGVWSDKKGRIYSSDQLIDGSGSGATASASVEYVDGVWKDYDGNVYEESELEGASAVAEVKFGQKTKALKFASDIGAFYLYRGSNSIHGGGLLVVERITEDQRATFYAQFKEVDDGAYSFSDFLNTIKVDDTDFDAVEETTGEVKDTDDEVVEAPEVKEDTTEDTTEVTEDTTEDTTEVTETPEINEDTEEVVGEAPEVTEDTADEEIDAEFSVTTTKDGRAVYAGEQVYIVKKGDCLWAIARQLLGNGERYKELFTRNGDIVKKAELIFPGQEIIAPTK